MADDTKNEDCNLEQPIPEDSAIWVDHKKNTVDVNNFENEINGTFIVYDNKLPDWCKERYCESYKTCKHCNPHSDTMPECFYGNYENETLIDMYHIKLLMALGHTRECALQFIFEDCFDDLHRRKCICHNTCATAFIDYDYYTTNFN